MAVDDLSRRVLYVGDGSSTEFAFNFVVFVTTDVAVYTQDEEGEDKLISPSNYTVTLNENQDNNPGGVVKFNSAPADEEIIAVVSAVPKTQPMALTTYDGFDPEVLNKSADRAVSLIQQLSDDVSRAIRLPRTSQKTAAAAYEDLVNAANTANEALALMDETITAAADVKEALEAAGDVTGAVPVAAEGREEIQTLSEWCADIVTVKAGESAFTVGSGTAARSPVERFSDVVNVKDFGAKGDGETDDTAAFRAAAQARGSFPAQVFVPAGTYYLASDPIAIPEYSSGITPVYWYIDAGAKVIGAGKLSAYPVYLGAYPDWYGEEFLPVAHPARTGSIPNSMRVIETDLLPTTRTALSLCTQTKQGLVDSDYAGFQSLVVNNNALHKSRTWSGYFESTRMTDAAGGTIGIEIANADASPGGTSDISPYGQLSQADGAAVDPYHASICLWLGAGAELEDLPYKNDISAFVGTGAGGARAKMGIVIGGGTIVTDSDGYANALALPKGYGIRWFSDKTTKTAGIRCDVTDGIPSELIFSNTLTRFCVRTASGLASAFQINHNNTAFTAGLLVTPAKSEGPVLEPVGSATNADIRLRGKGTGLVRFGTYSETALTPTGYISIRDSGGTVRRLLVG